MELNDEIRQLIMHRRRMRWRITTVGAPQRHAKSARGRLAEGAERRDYGGRSDACHAGILRNHSITAAAQKRNGADYSES